MVRKARRKAVDTGGDTVQRDKKVQGGGPRRVEKTKTVRKTKVVEKPGDSDGYQGGGKESLPKRDPKASKTSLKPWETTLAKQGKPVDRVEEATPPTELKPDMAADDAPKKKPKLQPDKAPDYVPTDPEDAEAHAYVQSRLAKIKARNAALYQLEKRLAAEAEHLRGALATSNGNAVDAAASNMKSRVSVSPEDRYWEEMVLNNHEPSLNGDDRMAEEAVQERKAAEKSDRERRIQKEHELQRMMESHGQLGGRRR